MLKINGKTVFITGGSGYVGRNLVRALLSEGANVRALARSPRAASIVQQLGAQPVLGDLLDEAALAAGLEGADYLIHAAADTSHAAQSASQNTINIAGTSLLYRVARRQKVARALHISTEAVLLTGSPLRNATEDMPIPPTLAGGYSHSKSNAERIARNANGREMSVVVIRPRFVWGKDDTTALKQLLSANASGRLVWIGGGDYLTSTTHVDNLCHGALLALLKGQGGEVYFISDGPPVRFREFVSEMLASQGARPTAKSLPRFLVRRLAQLSELLSRATGGRLQGPLSLQEYSTLGVEVTLDISKAQRELGYRPRVSRAQGLAELRNYPLRHDEA
ncbi:NAD-dependent epimerase/dehydratase family protein [Alkalilimnicola sp. S0819]|uniref:NAD-dependent epimerase/dehydratase family protein n=1 Tax=Alkalilimnicola sp. S0819 TaxID=2613922 RepID=UPI001261AE55|nr:NAD-dependent epimerase/dehydratase family protein [Alkalilimnicola sp. S0819]KAB7622611.1 NAD-dependent epimerase/dehydratase family protein [Alkalilimnicola sp. S0819]MPQ17381.1 NAD-dependent epimerase/dehydratase family protein [Alkalilimnicola sp. S0819]